MLFTIQCWENNNCNVGNCCNHYSIFSDCKMIVLALILTDAQTSSGLDNRLMTWLKVNTLLVPGLYKTTVCE